MICRLLAPTNFPRRPGHGPLLFFLCKVQFSVDVGGYSVGQILVDLWLRRFNELLRNTCFPQHDRDAGAVKLADPGLVQLAGQFREPYGFRWTTAK